MTKNDLKKNGHMTKVLSVSLLSIAITACTQTNSAQINDLSNSPSSQTSTATNTSSTYTQPPQNISTSNISTSNIDNTTTPVVTSNTVSTTNSNVMTTTQNRMVYNRKYDEIPKGGYNGETYTVQRGDTLYYVAWITGNDFRSLAAKNKVTAPYDLSVGQVLDVSGGTTVVVTEQQKTTNSNTANPTTTTTTTTTATTTALSNTKPMTQVTTTETKTAAATTSTTSSATTPSTTVANITWQWPAKGNVIEKFSNATKGIDIAGSLGDSVQAAAAGRVVYAGNALPGYGNLIIVKHNDDYLTAYAHNQTILVKEQQDVKAGQQIATMGNTGTNSVRLHFEIRYQAKSVDPLNYLPK